MKTDLRFLSMLLALALRPAASQGADPVESLDSAPPVVVRTLPMAGANQVNPAITEIQVTFSKSMQDRSWSWSTWGENTFPETAGEPRYLTDGRTCVLPVKLQPGRFYATWLNSETFRNFKDTQGRPAVPYLLTFQTSDHPVPSAAPPAATPAAARQEPGVDPVASRLNADQRLVLDWTDRQFRSFFDARTFEGWSDQERAELETRSLDALQGPQTRDYYQAISTLAALRSSRALPKLRELAFERRDKNNRDRWMAIRALGLLNDRAAIPDLIHLVYHGNINTRWWAQISLVRLTDQNFGKDWNAWGHWWNGQDGQPPYQSEIIRWWDGQAEPDKLAESLDKNDAEFLAKLRS